MMTVYGPTALSAVVSAATRAVPLAGTTVVFTPEVKPVWLTQVM